MSALPGGEARASRQLELFREVTPMGCGHIDRRCCCWHCPVRFTVWSSDVGLWDGGDHVCVSVCVWKRGWSLSWNCNTFHWSEVSGPLQNLKAFIPTVEPTWRKDSQWTLHSVDVVMLALEERTGRETEEGPEGQDETTQGDFCNDVTTIRFTVSFG